MADTGTVIYLILLIALLIFSALFSASETALFSLSRARILSYRRDKSALKRIVAELVDNYHPTLITLVICNMVTNIGITIINNHLMGGLHFPAWLELTLSMLISIIVLLLFGEIIPKTLALLFPEKLSMRIAFPLYLIRRILAPLIFCSDKILVISTALFGRKQPVPLLPAEYDSYLDSAAATGTFTTAETELLHNIFAMRSKTVTTAMVPRIETIGIAATANAGEVQRIIRQTKREFYPVFTNDLDDAEFFLSARAFFLLSGEERRQWQQQHRLIPAISIPEKAKLTLALSVLRREQLPAALTVDEYGRVTGMLPVKSIYSEMVNKLEDKYSVTDYYLERLDNDTWSLDGAIPLNTLEDITGIQIPENYLSHTLNGLFSEISGKIPQLGDEIILFGWKMHAETVSHHRVVKVKLQREPLRSETEVEQ
jgi:CBS domain containing-hemolysin-like protein